MDVEAGRPRGAEGRGRRWRRRARRAGLVPHQAAAGVGVADRVPNRRRLRGAASKDAFGAACAVDGLALRRLTVRQAGPGAGAGATPVPDARAPALVVPQPGRGGRPSADGGGLDGEVAQVGGVDACVHQCRRPATPHARAADAHGTDLGALGAAEAEAMIATILAKASGPAGRERLRVGQPAVPAAVADDRQDAGRVGVTVVHRSEHHAAASSGRGLGRRTGGGSRSTGRNECAPMRARRVRGAPSRWLRCGL